MLRTNLKSFLGKKAPVAAFIGGTGALDLLPRLDSVTDAEY
jgi:hypothetical protein